MVMCSVTSKAPGKPEAAWGQHAPHLKLQAQVTRAPLFHRQRLSVGDQVLQDRPPDLALRAERDRHARGPPPSGAHGVVSKSSSRPATEATSGIPICSWIWK